ncbi:MAG: hypothetical protein V4603_11030 [Pseudomonadota bacterium]
MKQQNCLVIATVLDVVPGGVKAALAPDGSASANESSWICFGSARAALEWAAGRGIVVDGKGYTIAPILRSSAAQPIPVNLAAVKV